MIKTTPKNLLDTVIRRQGLKNDAALARGMDVPPPVISKIRHGRLSIGDTMLVRLHDFTGISIADLKSLGGLPVGLRSMVA